jgi:hypothetical protein
MIKKLAAGILAVGLLTGGAYAAAPAFDSAADSTYDSTWSDGQNGGTGFGAWSLTGGSSAGSYMGDSSQNGTPTSGDINTAGRSWAEYAFGGQTASAVRPFTSGGPNSDITLAVGQGISLAFDNGFIQDGGTVGFGLQNSSGTNRFEFYYIGNDSTDSYKININGTQFNLDPQIGFTTNGFSEITFMQGASNSWSLTVTENSPSGTTTYSSADFADLAASDISQIRLFDFNSGDSGGGQGFNAMFNSLAVVPEPAGWILFLVPAVLGTLLLRRRRRHA